MDFVITWVNGNDPAWKEELKKYQQIKSGDTDNERFRDWENLRYWFRGIEQFAPWVNKIHFVTWGHLPEWLNTEHPKLNIVKHEDYIPEKYLPTFNSRTIELNFHHIAELSEEYVYFNDDMFVINHVQKKDFFKNGKPCDMGVTAPNMGGYFGLSLLTNTTVVNNHFDKLQAIKQKPLNWFNLKYGRYNIMNLLLLAVSRHRHTGFRNFHLPQASLKSTLNTLWEKEFDFMNENCENTFRNYATVNPYVQRYWELASNNFYPKDMHAFGKLFMLGKTDTNLITDFIKKQNKPLICLNDYKELREDITPIKGQVNQAFESILPEKSEYEE